MGHIVKIGRYEIIDAELDGKDVETIAIPCHTNPGLTYQLDGWDNETTVPAWIDGQAVNLAISHYDQEKNRWILTKSA